jgi:putative redox protein
LRPRRAAAIWSRWTARRKAADAISRRVRWKWFGTGGCTAYDVVMILKKSRQEIAGCSVTLKAERASEDPKVFTKIHFHFTVTGKNLNPATVERAINLSHDKYCSASIMIAKTAELTHSFEIVAG